MSNQTPTVAEKIAELERYEAQATPGPWLPFTMAADDNGTRLTPEQIGDYVKNSVIKSYAESGSDKFIFVSCEKEDGPADVCHVGNGPTSPQNAAFITALRNHALPVIKEQQASIDQLEADNRRLREYMASIVRHSDEESAAYALARAALSTEAPHE